MSKDNVCAVLREAGIKSPDWKKIAKSLGLDSIILSAVFFSQWSAFAHDCHPSWKTLAKALENMNSQKYKQAAKKASQAEGAYSFIVKRLKGLARDVNLPKQHLVIALCITL